MRCRPRRMCPLLHDMVGLRHLFPWPCHGMWQFHLCNPVKRQPFSFCFGWFHHEPFCRISLWNFRKKSRLCHGTWLFCFSNILKIYAFSPNFPLAGSVIGEFSWLFLWNFKEIKHQPFSMTQPRNKVSAFSFGPALKESRMGKGRKPWGAFPSHAPFPPSNVFGRRGVKRQPRCKPVAAVQPLSASSGGASLVAAYRRMGTRSSPMAIVRNSHPHFS